MLLESGALCERDTFQGERCLYNALNDRIRNLLLSYDYSKSTDPLQPFAAHITSLLARDRPDTTDIAVDTYGNSFRLHKLLLSARSPYFAKKLATDPNTTLWKTSHNTPSRALEIAIRYLYLAEVQVDLGESEEDQAILAGIERLGRTLEIERLFESIVESGDRRQARQRRTEELERGRNQMEAWFRNNVLKNKVEIDTAKIEHVRWDRENAIFADVLLRADYSVEETDEHEETSCLPTPPPELQSNNLGIPIGPRAASTSRSPSRARNTSQRPRKSVLFPAHRAMLIRADFFNTMFSSSFRESIETPHLQVIPIDCSPEVLEIVLTFLYTEKVDFPLDISVDVLFAADMLFIDRLKIKAAMIISTLGNGNQSVVESENPRGETDVEDVIDIYDVIRAGWETRVHRLEEFGARFIAQRLERYIDDEDFAQLVKESAARIRGRQETDTVELIDDIRYYLSERFRLRFEDTGFDEMMDEDAGAGAKSDIVGAAQAEDLMEGDDRQLASQMEIHEQSGGVIRTLDGEVAGDEFAQDAINYQILLGKIDKLLDTLSLDA